MSFHILVFIQTLIHVQEQWYQIHFFASEIIAYRTIQNISLKKVFSYRVLKYRQRGHSQGSITDQGVHDVLVSQESLRLDVRKLQGGVILHGFLVFIDIHQALNHFQRTLHPHGHLNVKWVFFLWWVKRMIGNWKWRIES